MSKILKRISVLICVCLVAVCALSTLTGSKDVISTPVRDVELIEQSIDYQSVLEKFEGGILKQEGNIVTFEGTQKLDLNAYNCIDNLSESDIENYDNVSILYKFSYDYENEVISLTASMADGEGNIEMDTITGKPFLDSNGEVDAVMDIDGEYVLLSEMKNVGMIENCGWFKRLVKSVVKVAVVTAAAVAVAAVVVGTGGTGAIAVIAVVGTVTCAASTTQTVRANINYSNNKKASLHDDVNTEGYITDQSKYKDWSFGFATLDEVGCEVIATYNTMISIDKKKELYDVIYDFEMYNIDYDLGFGHLGSNPEQIYRYFVKHGVKYKSFSSLNSLQNEVNTLDVCQIVFTSKNDHSILGIHSIHTFELRKNNEGEFFSYNGYNDHLRSSELSGFVQYGFNYAYIVYAS